MKSNRINFAATAFLFLAMSFCTYEAVAQDRVGNGGDICEDRIKVIQNDITLWVQGGGAAGLVFPAAVSQVSYESKMLAALSSAVVSCTETRIQIGNVEKTCANSVDAKGKFSLVCNRDAFLKTNESDQYVLIHHEYAGLAGFEVNDGPISQYLISNQISEFLIEKIVKQLAIRKVTPTSRQQVCASALDAKANFVKLIERQVQVGEAMQTDLKQAKLDYQELALQCQAITLQQFCAQAPALAREVLQGRKGEFKIGQSDLQQVTAAEDQITKSDLECNQY